MKTASDPRHKNRIKLMQYLYSSAVQKCPSSEILHIWNHLDTIDPLVIKSAPEWPLEKLNPVDLAILRLAIYELTIDKTAPFKVIIDEAIELAKEYGSEASPSFINGALGTAVKHLNEPQS